MLGVHFVIASFSVCFETRSLVLARDDVVVGAGGFFVGVYFLFLRHKNIRTKGSLNVQMSVQASLTYLCSFNVLHLRCLVCDSFVV